MLPDLSQINWFMALQSAGIIASFLIASYTAWTQARARKLSNYMELVKSHREVWKLQWQNDQLADLLKVADASAKPLTYAEIRFLNFLFLHVTCAYEFTKADNVIKIEELRRDIKELLDVPVVRKFWEENKRFYNSGFIKFIDGLI